MQSFNRFDELIESAAEGCNVRRLTEGPKKERDSRSGWGNDEDRALEHGNGILTGSAGFQPAGLRASSPPAGCRRTGRQNGGAPSNMAEQKQPFQLIGGRRGSQGPRAPPPRPARPIPPP